MIHDHFSHVLKAIQGETLHLYCLTCNRCVWSKPSRADESGEWDDETQLVTIGDAR